MLVVEGVVVGLKPGVRASGRGLERIREGIKGEGLRRLVRRGPAEGFWKLDGLL